MKQLVVYSCDYLMRVPLRFKYRLCHFFKAKHWKGHGVHSPYLFYLINDIVGNKHHRYYIYDRLAKGAVCKPALKTENSRYLFFRLLNFFQPLSVLYLGESFEDLDRAICGLGTSLSISREYCSTVDYDLFVVAPDYILSAQEQERLQCSGLPVFFVAPYRSEGSRMQCILARKAALQSLDFFHFVLCFSDPQVGRINAKIRF